MVWPKDEAGTTVETEIIKSVSSKVISVSPTVDHLQKHNTFLYIPMGAGVEMGVPGLWAGEPSGRVQGG